MARSIITCTGETITIGDKVRTPDGSIITVRGAAIGLKFHNAEECTVVPVTTTKKNSVNSRKLKPGPNPVTDCIIWGD